MGSEPEFLRDIVGMGWWDHSCRGETYWLIDSSSRTNHVHFPKLFLGHDEHPLQVSPLCDISPLEVCFRGAARGRVVLGYQLLGLGTEIQVGEQDIAVAAQESAGEGEVDT